jgi:putative membrane protein
MLLVLWRNTRMIQEIASLYGMKATLTSRFVLFRRVLYNMAFVGVSELVTEIGSDLFGWSVAAKLSARVGQGIGAGLLTGRMGIQAMQLCRPIPFSDKERPRLREIRSRVLTRLSPEPAGA